MERLGLESTRDVAKADGGWAVRGPILVGGAQPVTSVG